MALVNPIRNNAYTVTSGLLVTNSNTAAQAVATGYIADRTQVSGVISSSTVPSFSGTTFTYTTTAAHGLNVGDLVTITGVIVAGATSNKDALSGTFVVTSVPSTTTFTVTGSATPTGGTLTVTAPTAAFTTADIRIAAATVTPTIGTATGGPNNTSSALTTANYQRYDVIAIDTTTGSLTAIQGTAVASTGTPVVPAVADPKYLALAVVLISSTDGSTVTTSGNPIDVRNTSEYAPVRAFNRSQNVRIGGNKVTPSNDSYIPVDNQVARKELGYHSAIGAVYNSGPVTLSNSDYVVHHGGAVYVSALTGVTAPTIQSGELLNRLTGTYVPFSNNAVTWSQTTGATQTALTATQFPASGTAGYSINYVVVVNKFTGIISVLSGAVASITGTQTTQALTTAQQALYVPLAVVTVDNTPQITNIRDIRPRA